MDMPQDPEGDVERGDQTKNLLVNCPNLGDLQHTTQTIKGKEKEIQNNRHKTWKEQGSEKEEECNHG